MINLLPPEAKKQLLAGRTNVLLLRYNILLLIAVVFLAAAAAYVYLYLQTAQQTANDSIKTNASKVVSYAPVQQQADAFRSSLSTAKQILDNQVSYSDAIISIANLVPSGVILQGLTLTPQSFGSQMTLVGYAKTEARAVAFKNSFQNSPLFSDVHFDSITSGTSNTGNSADYPLTVNLDVT